MKILLSDITLKQLGEADLPEIMDVQEQTFAALEDSNTLRRNTPETFAVCFEKPSVAYGVMYQGQMIAFGMLYCAGENDENLGKSLDTPVDLSKVANVKVIIVRPAFRGNGLQKYLIAKLEQHAKANGYTIFMATAAPDNKYSMDNFLSSGYTCVKVLKKYGGLQRALLYKEV